MQDKEILIGKMLDSDSVLSDEDLELIMQDDELREILEVSAALRSSSIQPTAIDVEKEWRIFRHKLHPKPSRWRWAMRVAAIFIGVLSVSAIVKVAIDRLMTADVPAVVAEAKPSATAATSVTVGMTEPLTTVETETPATPAKASAPRKKTETPSIPALTEEEEMEVDEYLRLQQARIDNDLAMMQAELYVDELQALRDLDPTPPPIEAESRLIVMP